MWLPFITKKTVPQWLRESRKVRTAALVFAGFVFLNLLLYVLLIAPSAARLSTRQVKFGELRKRHTEAVFFQRQKQAFAGIRDGIPAQKDMPLLVKELVQTARKLNLSVGAINYDIPRRGSGELAMLAFTFPAEGRYADVKRYIFEVETSEHLVGIQDVQFDSDRGRVKLTMKLMTYIREQ